MSWLYLVLAGCCEIIWAVALRYCDGIKNVIPLLIVIIAMIFSMAFLEFATKTISISIAYPILTGIGIIGIFTYGIVVLKEPLLLLNVFFVSLIFIGIVGLKIFNQ